ncbi:MAG: ZIP family metal transporter, partial [Fibrobacter sp.]|nr:ZIP family metal transporter [Fibrobacter sp.]
MNVLTLQVILIPFLGTVLGAACVFLLRREMGESLKRSLSGFAAGVMVAASVWSLLVPAMEGSASLGKFAFMPAVVGFWLGILFLLFLDNVVPHMHANHEKEGPAS